MFCHSQEVTGLESGCGRGWLLLERLTEPPGPSSPQGRPAVLGLRAIAPMSAALPPGLLLPVCVSALFFQGYQSQ